MNVRFALFSLCAALTLAPSSHAADLTFLFEVEITDNGIDRLVISNDGTNAYAVDVDEPQIIPYDIDPGAAVPNIMQAISMGEITGIIGLWDIAISPDGAHVYVTRREAPPPDPGNLVESYRREVDGTLTLIDSDTAPGDPFAITTSRDGNQVYVSAVGSDVIHTYTRAGDGTLTFVTSTPAIGLVDPWDIAVGGDDKSLLVSTFDDTAIGILFYRDANGGLQNPVQVEPLSFDKFSKIVTTTRPPLGDAAYFGVQSATAQNPGIAAIAISCDDGTMTCTPTFLDLIDEGNVPAGLDTLVGLDVSPDNRSLVASANIDDQIVTFTRSGNGTLSFFETIARSSPTAIAISDDGVYTLSTSTLPNNSMRAYLPEPGAAALGLAALAGLGTLAGRRRQRESRA